MTAPKLDYGIGSVTKVPNTWLTEETPTELSVKPLTSNVSDFGVNLFKNFGAGSLSGELPGLAKDSSGIFGFINDPSNAQGFGVGFHALKGLTGLAATMDNMKTAELQREGLQQAIDMNKRSIALDDANRTSWNSYTKPSSNTAVG